MTSGRPSVVDGLDVNEVADGLIVYDETTDRVHYLNATAAIVFTLCDGERDVDGIARAVAAAYGAGEPLLAEVEDCLAQLTKEGLLR